MSQSDPGAKAPLNAIALILGAIVGVFTMGSVLRYNEHPSQATREAVVTKYVELCESLGKQTSISAFPDGEVTIKCQAYDSGEEPKK